MAFTDLITGLAFVSGHLSLRHLDTGLRGSIDIPTNELNSHVQALARSAQAVTVSNQIQQLRGRADRLRKQQHNAEHAQLMVQIGQLELQLQQLSTQRQHLELEAKRELRLAQENRILRDFVDLYSQAQIYQQQTRLLDYVVVVLAALRIHRQVYNDLDDAVNRLRLTELQEKLFNGLRGVLESPESRKQIASTYVVALKAPVDLVQKGTLSLSNATKAIQMKASLRSAPDDGDWARSTGSVSYCTEYLGATRDALRKSRGDYKGFSGDLDPADFLFVAFPHKSSGLVPATQNAWTDLVRSIEMEAGMPLKEMHSALRGHPKQFEQREQEVIASLKEAQHLWVAHQLGHAFTFLKNVIRPYRERFGEINDQFQQIEMPNRQTDPEQVLLNCLKLLDVRAELTEFSEMLTFLEANSAAGGRKYLTQASKYLVDINAAALSDEAQVRDAFALSRGVSDLEGKVTRAIQRCKASLYQAAKGDSGFEEVDNCLRTVLSESQFADVESKVATYEPNAIQRVLSSLRSGKDQVDRRRHLIDYALQTYSESLTRQDIALPSVTSTRVFPDL